MIKFVFTLIVSVLLLACNKPATQQQADVAIESVATGATSNPEQNEEGSINPDAFPDIDMTLKKVSEHVYYVEGAAGEATDNQGFISNAGIVVTSKGIVLFDGLATPALARALLQKIRAISDLPVKYVVVSHYHADHIYGLQVFKDEGAMILGPNGAELYLESEAAQQRLEERRVSLYPWVDENTRLITPDEYITESRLLDMGDVKLAINHLGGAHSDGDLAMFVEPDAVLFSGDIIFEGRIPFVGDANTRAWLDALAAMSERKVSALIPGHGAKAEKPNEAVELTRSYLAFLREQMGAAVEDLVSFDEAYAGVDWSAFAELPAFEGANRRNAYQVYLSLEAESLAPQ